MLGQRNDAECPERLQVCQLAIYMAKAASEVSEKMKDPMNNGKLTTCIENVTCQSDNIQRNILGRLIK